MSNTIDVTHKPKRVVGKPFAKGVSGNPGGRLPGFKGMASYIRKKTRNGEALVDFALTVFENEEKNYTHVHRWDAMKWLADRGFGKSVQTIIDLGGDAMDDLSAQTQGLDPDKLQELEEKLAEILG